MASPAARRTTRPALLIGLTGGIGSGKSAAASAFRELGVPVLDADLVARQVVEPGEPALAAIAHAFGDAVIAADGTLDRAALGAVVFADRAARKRLEAITHPAIRKRMDDWLTTCTADYAVWEIPLLVETDGASRVDRVLVIDVPPAIQRARVMARDGTDEAAVQRVLDAQVSRAARLAQADDVIDNSGSPAALDDAVLALHARYLALAGDVRT